MKPLDYRNATWRDLQAKLAGQRLAVYKAWCLFGPGTTEEVAARAQISILSFRPRTTELFELGLVELRPEIPNAARGGVYAAVPLALACQRFETTKEHRHEQTLLAIV